MHLTSLSLPVFLLLLLDSVCANLIPRAEKPPKEPDPECTVTNPLTNEFYDLRPLIRHGSDQYPLLLGLNLYVGRTGIYLDMIMDETLLSISVNRC
jgi:hypothetical protein